MNRQIGLFSPEQMYLYVIEQLKGDPYEEPTTLESLFDYVTRSARLKWDIHLYRLLYIFFDLSFKLQKQYKIKEMLKAYRMVTQNQYTDSLKSVLEYYRDKKLEVLLKDIEKRPESYIKEIDDIESEYSPEDLLISSFKLEDKKQRDELKNNMRIVWDGLKSIIETVKINQKLYDLYIETLQKIFTFADKYNRKHEFKRYCDTLRTGLQNVLKSKQERAENQKTIFIDIENAEVNERNVVVRLEQFYVATRLGLWQYSFQILYDINTLMRARKGTIKKLSLARYYLNLSKLFKKSNYWNYHAFTYFNYYNIYTKKPDLTAEQHTNMTNELLLSVMCIPPFSIERNQNEDSQNKISQMITRTNRIPDKQELYHLILEKGIVEGASPEIKQLWAFLFIEFKILEVPEKLKLLDKVRETDFASLIEDVIIYQELIEISKIYSCVRFENILKMIPFDKQRVLTILLNTKEHDVLQFEFDESKNLIIFRQKEMDSDAFLTLRKLARDVTFLAERIIKPNEQEVKKQANLFLDGARDYYDRIRPDSLQKFKDDLKKPMRELRSYEAERERKEQLERQEQEKKRKEQEQQARKKYTQLLEEINKKRNLIKDIIRIKGKRIVKIEGKKIETLDEDDIREMAVKGFYDLFKQTENIIKQESYNKYKKAFTRVDYLDRARREKLQILLENEWVYADKEIDNVQKNLREAFEKQKIKSEKLYPAKEFITKYLDQLTQQRKKYHEKKVEEYRERITLYFKERVLAKAKYMKEEKERKERESDAERIRRYQEIRQQGPSDDGGWRRTGPVTAPTTTSVTNPSQQTQKPNDWNFRNQPQQPITRPVGPTQTQPSVQPKPYIGGDWRKQNDTKPAYVNQPPTITRPMAPTQPQSSGITRPGTTTVQPKPYIGGDWRKQTDTKPAEVKPSGPPTFSSSKNTNTFITRNVEKKEYPKKYEPKKEEPKKETGWRRGP